MANRVPEPAAGYEPYYLPGMESVHRSLELDPGFRPAMKLLLTMATEESDRTHDPWIIDAVARLSRIDSTPPPDAFLVLARDRRLADDLVAAREALSRYLAVGGDAGVAALERARLLAADSSYDRAADAYRDGLRALSPRARTLYRRDLAWVAEPEDLATFDGVALDSLAGWIRWFWTKRDAEAVRPPGTRLREHLRRWAHVEREYRVGEPRFRAPLNPPLLQDITLCSTELERMTLDDVGIDTPTLPSDLRGWEPIFDHRAAVYMRHGPPVRRIWQFLGSADKLEIPGAPGRRAQTQGVVGPDFDNPLLSPVVEDSGQLRLQPTLEEVYGPTGADAALLADSTYLYRETWSYFFAGRLRLVTFRGSAALGPGPTTLVPVLPLDATYLEAVTTLGNPYGRDFARARHDATVRREARATGVSSNRATPSTRCTMAGARLEESVAEDFQTAAKTDSYTLLFPKDLDPGAVAFGMPSENGGNEGTVLGAFSVPIHNLRIDSTADGGRTTALRIRVTATDRADHRALIRDTLRTFSLPAGGTRGGTLSGLVEIPAPPGRYDMRVAVQLPDSSAGNAIEIPQAVEVWRPDGELRVSDLVTGGDAGNLRWSYGGENVAVHPATAFGRGATVELFYVQGGLRVGETYETAIAVTRAGKTAAVVSVRFEEEARLTVERKRRGLALRDVEPGEYDLTLTLREVGRDRVTSHTRRITVAD